MDDEVRWDALTEVSLVRTGDGPAEEDVFLVCNHSDGPDTVLGLDELGDVLARIQALPGFDNEAFISAMARTRDGVSVLWRR
jgi:hypothetical protein